MTDKQYDQQGSFLKSDDFLDDNADKPAITAITQIAPLATELKSKLAEITVADGIGSQDNTGYAKLKGARRAELVSKILKISRGATALYVANDDVVKQKMVDFIPSNFDSMIPEKLFAIAKKLFDDTNNDKERLINATTEDHAELMTAANTFFAVSTEPKDAIELSKIYNALINPLLSECRTICKKIDIYMQTLIASEALLYAEWKETLSIDNTGAHNPAVLILELSVPNDQILNVDYTEFSLSNNSEIKLINKNDATIEYGFGPNETTFNGTPTTVAAQSQQRKTAVSLGYHSIENNKLNIRNTAREPIAVTLEFYDMA